MYDIEIIVAFHGGGKYLQRFEDFKKYGLLNIGNHKVLCTAICEEIEGLKDGWPEGVDVNHYLNPHVNPARKLYDYYANYPIENVDNIRWSAKFDDDSVTDISGLIETLDKEYDYKKSCYFITEMNSNIRGPEKGIMENLGYGHLFIHGGSIWHEWEGCVLSQKALRQILSCPKAVELLVARSTHLDLGPSDICLGCAAKIAGVFAADVYFLSRHPYIGDFSIFGGHLNHIHFVARDINTDAWQFLKKKIETPIPDEIKNKFLGQYAFHSQGNSSANIINLAANWKIENSLHLNESLWHIEEDKLFFIGLTGNETSCFDQLEYGDGKCKFAEGKFLTNNDLEIVHCLHRLVT